MCVKARWIFVAFTLCAVTSFVGSAPAQQQNCRGAPGIAWDTQIDACTAAIQSGRLQGTSLALTLSNRGVAYRHKGQYDRAIQDYDQAIRLTPNDPDTFNNRCAAYTSKGEHDRAIQDCDQAIKLKPNEANYFYNRGNAYISKNQYDRAIQDYDQAIRLNPNDPDIFSNRCGAYIHKGQYDRAIQDCDQAIKLNPNDANAFLNRGNAYNKKGQFDRANQDYDKATEYFEAEAKTQYIQGGYLDAIASYQRVIDVVGNTASPAAIGQMYVRIGNANVKLNNKDAAMVAFGKAAAIAPNPGEAYFNLCATMYNAGLPAEKTVAACNNAIAADPKLANAYFIKGSVLVGQGTLDKNNKFVVPPGTVDALKQYLVVTPNGPHASEVKVMLDSLK